MVDLSFYSLLVAVKSFEPVTENLVADYYAQSNHLSIDDLFMVLADGSNRYKETFDEILEYCSSAASSICAGYGVAEKFFPIFKAYLIPYDYSVSTDEDRNKLLSLYESAANTNVSNDEPAWYLRENIRYRLMSIYVVSSDDIDKIKELLPKVKAGKEQYDKWLAKER